MLWTETWAALRLGVSTGLLHREMEAARTKLYGEEAQQQLPG